MHRSHSIHLASVLLLATTLSPSTANAQIRYSCGQSPGPLRAISNDIIHECNAVKLTELMIEYSQASRYYFCMSDLARRARDTNYDDTLYQLTGAQINLALASLKAGKLVLSRNSNPADLQDGLGAVNDALAALSKAQDTAGQASSASDSADENHRKGMNALHQANNAEKILKQWEQRRKAGEQCPPSDEPPDPFSEENRIPDDEAPALGAYSGFGIEVRVLEGGHMEISSDCRDADHRIQIRGVVDGKAQGTWQTIAVGTATKILSPPQDRDYQIRRRCAHQMSNYLTVPFRK